MKLGLENIRRLLAVLGDPQKNYLKVQVAGTNGKGSVCAFLNSICLTAGIRTGMYTSPHLVSITERVKIDGLDITEDEFARLATLVRGTSEKLSVDGVIDNVPTFFEQVTAIALLAFAEAKVELAILETGLGGRLDATTAAEAEIAAITKIDLDHQRYLGETIEKIAAEKTAIIHAGSRVVALRQSREVEQVIKGRCREVRVVPAWTTNEIQIKRDRSVAPWLIATFATERSSYGNILFINMLGEHQIENAAVAIGIAEILSETGFGVGQDDVIAGLENTKHPGRLEYLEQRFLVDGAHNIGGAFALKAYLDEFASRPVTMIFGAMRDKDIGEIASVLFPVAHRLILTTPDNSRALSTDDLLKVVPADFDPQRLVLTRNVTEAIAKAREVAKDDQLIVVTGSLYLVGEVRRILTTVSPEKLKTNN